MTIIGAVRQVDGLRPNGYSLGQKILWLSQLESMVQRLVIDPYGREETRFTEFTEQTDTGTTLLMPAPFDMAYLYWLEAQIHYAGEDKELYNSAMAMFRAVFDAYKADYRRNRMPVGQGRFRF